MCEESPRAEREPAGVTGGGHRSLSPRKKRHINFKQTFTRNRLDGWTRHGSISLALSSLAHGMRSKKGALSLAFVATGECWTMPVMLMIGFAQKNQPPFRSTLRHTTCMIYTSAARGGWERQGTAVTTPGQHTRKRGEGREDCGRGELTPLPSTVSLCAQTLVCMMSLIPLRNLGNAAALRRHMNTGVDLHKRCTPRHHEHPCSLA